MTLRSCKKKEILQEELEISFREFHHQESDRKVLHTKEVVVLIIKVILQLQLVENMEDLEVRILINLDTDQVNLMPHMIPTQKLKVFQLNQKKPSKRKENTVKQILTIIKIRRLKKRRRRVTLQMKTLIRIQIHLQVEVMTPTQIQIKIKRQNQKRRLILVLVRYLKPIGILKMGKSKISQ
jgi:acylphosphatase